MLSNLHSTPEQVTADESGPIRVRIRELAQLFNSIDPSPFLERDLDRDAELFIVSWARDLHAREPLELIVQIDRQYMSEIKSDQVVRAIHNFFSRRRTTIRRELHTLLRRGRTSLIIGLVFLSLCVSAANLFGKMISREGIAEVVREGLTVAGWVAMWRPMEIFLYSWWPLVGDGRLYERLSHMPIHIEPLETETDGEQLAGNAEQ